MYFVETPTAEGLGHRSHPAGGQAATVAADLPRALDLVRAPAPRRDVRITRAAHSRIRGDYATGRPEPAQAGTTAAEHSFPRSAARPTGPLSRDARPVVLGTHRSPEPPPDRRTGLGRIRLRRRHDRPAQTGLGVCCAGGMQAAGAAPSRYTARREAVEALAAARAMGPAAD